MDCKICLLLFNEKNQRPMVLECGHTLCYTCLKSIISTQRECPFDKKEIHQSLKEISTNFYIMENLEEVPSPSNPQEKKQNSPPNPLHNPSSSEFQEINYYPSFNLDSIEGESNFYEEEDMIFGFQDMSMDPPLESSVKCPNQHNLRFCEMISLRYELEGHESERTVYCDVCASNLDSGWHCSVCSYDICENCYIVLENRGSSESENLVLIGEYTCERGHKLIFTCELEKYFDYQIMREKAASCNICDKEDLCSAWNCSECRYNMCLDCEFMVDDNKSNAGIVECFQGHVLEWVLDITRRYIELNGSCWTVICNFCRKEGLKSSWNCSRCQFDACEECFRQLNN